MIFQLTPYALLIVVGALFSAMLALSMWRRRGEGVIPLVTLTAAAAFWGFGNALELSLTSISAKTLLSNVQYIGITTAIAAWFAFSLQYTGRSRWLNRRTLALMALEPIAVIFAAFTNSSHHLFRTSVELSTGSTLSTLDVTFGPLFWGHAIYSYLLMLSGTVLLILAFIRSPELYRGQVVFLLVGAFAPWIANAIFIAGLSPLPAGVDLTPLSFAITGLALGWSIYRYRLLDMVPIARDTVFETLNDPVFVIDQLGRLVDLNPAAAMLLEVTPAQVVGQLASTVFARHENLTAKLALTDETRDELTIGIGEAERTLTLHITPVRNRQGHMTAKVCVLYDITSLKRASQALKESEERNRSLLEATFEAIIIHDKGIILDVNRAFEEMFGYTRTEVLNQSALMLTDDETRPTVLANIQSGSLVPYEATGIRKDGASLVGEIRAKEATYRGQSVRVVAIRDISERKQAERAIREQNAKLIQANHELALARARAEEATRLKSEFLSIMSHELRTPLNAVVGYSQLLLEGMTGDLLPKQRDNLERIFANAKTLLNLINDILDLARIEARRMEIMSSPFQLRDWANDLMQQTEGLAANKDLAYTLEIDPALPNTLMGDVARLRQIALNLISNAIKFTELGFVRIEIKKHGEDGWAFIIHDSGIGIPPHAQVYIFDEFRQVDGSTQRRHSGTGLGLAIVRNLATLMNGSIQVESRVGHGSTFTLALPLLIPEPEIAD